MVLLVLRLLLAPALVVATSMAGRRWGPSVAGTLAGLPVVAGPVLLVVALEQGTMFASGAAAGALLGIVAVTVFCLVVVALAGRAPWPLTLIAGWAAVLAVDAGTSLLPRLSPALLFGVAVAAATLVIVATRRLVPERTGGHISWPWWDLPARAVATAAMTLSLTLVAAALGPHVTGMLAPFPVATSVLVAFALAHEGPAAAVTLLGGLLRGLYGFAIFCLTLGLLLEPLGIAAAFVLALAATAIVQVAVTFGVFREQRDARRGSRTSIQRPASRAAIAVAARSVAAPSSSASAVPDRNVTPIAAAGRPLRSSTADATEA
jgi:hypothetical protein